MHRNDRRCMNLQYLWRLFKSSKWNDHHCSTHQRKSQRRKAIKNPKVELKSALKNLFYHATQWEVFFLLKHACCNSWDTVKKKKKVIAVQSLLFTAISTTFLTTQGFSCCRVWFALTGKIPHLYNQFLQDRVRCVCVIVVGLSVQLCRNKWLFQKEQSF